MDAKVLGGWLMGLTIAEGALLILCMSASSPDDFYGLLGLTMIAQAVFAILGARRLMK